MILAGTRGEFRGGWPFTQDINDALAVSIIRGDHELAATDPQVRLQPGDKLLVIRQSR